MRPSRACHQWWALGSAGAVGRVRLAGIVLAAVGGTGVDDRADDGGRSRAAGCRRSRPLCRAGRRPGTVRRDVVLSCGPGPAGLSRRSTLTPGAGRLHGRCGDQPDRQPTRHAQRRSGQGRRIRRPDRLFHGWPAPRALADDNALRGLAGGAGAARVADAASAGIADRDARRDGHGERILPGPQRYSRGRPGPWWSTRTGCNRHSTDRRSGAARSGRRHRDRRVLRQRVDCPDVRGTKGRVHRRQCRVAGARCLQFGCRCGPRFSGQLQRQPNRGWRRRRQPHPALLVSRPRVPGGRHAHLTWPVGDVSDRRAGSAGGVRRGAADRRAEFRRPAHFRRSEPILALGAATAVLGLGVLYGVLAAIGLSIADLLPGHTTACWASCQA